MKLSFDLTGATSRRLCHTRWTAKAKSSESASQNCEALLETLFSILFGNDRVECVEVKGEASGAHTKIEKFDPFLCHRCLCRVLFNNGSAKHNLAVQENHCNWSQGWISMQCCSALLISCLILLIFGGNRPTSSKVTTYGSPYSKRAQT